MFAKFNQLGTQVLSLMRRSGPVLYDLENSGAPMRFSHPEYKNICTLKSPCFVGDTDEVLVEFLLHVLSHYSGCSVIAD